MRDPERTLPVITESLRDLLNVALAVQWRPLEFRVDDHFGWMLFVFFAKQAEHARGILALAEKGLYRDAGLIVRSMMEGFVQLLWACADPMVRARAWKEFTYVSSWRKMLKHEQAGRGVAPEVRARIEELLRTHGQQFLTEKGRRRLRNGKALCRKDYSENWTGRSYAELFREVEGAGEAKEPILHLCAYSELSDWQHWSPEIMGQAVPIDSESGGATYLEPSAMSGALAVANAFQALFQTLEHLDAHFRLNLSQRLDELRGAYVAHLDGIAANGPASRSAWEH